MQRKWFFMNIFVISMQVFAFLAKKAACMFASLHLIMNEMSFNNGRIISYSMFTFAIDVQAHDQIHITIMIFFQYSGHIHSSSYTF